VAHKASSYEDLCDAELVAGAKDGSVECFSLLVERHAPMAYGVALRLVGNHADAQDVAQESLLAAWTALGRFRGECAFETWLHTIAARRAASLVSRRRRCAELPDELPDAEGDPAWIVEAAQEREGLRRAVAALPEPQREVVRLCHLEGDSYTAAADQTGLTARAVASHLLRARRSLRRSVSAWA
jgi:RNA polymerase sigma-70 factor (ECF subfamily)